MAGTTQEELMQAIQRRAMEIIELPLEKRENRYALFRRVHHESALKAGMTKEQAVEAEAKMDEFVRAMVKIIETGGGAAGGLA